MILYVLKMGERFKVGITKDITKRLKSYRTHNGHHVELLRQVGSPHVRAIERAVHSYMKDHQVKGEWYDYTVMNDGLVHEAIDIELEKRGSLS